MYENGKLLGEIKPFEDGILIRDFNMTKIRHDRLANKPLRSVNGILKPENT